MKEIDEIRRNEQDTPDTGEETESSWKPLQKRRIYPEQQETNKKEVTKKRGLFGKIKGYLADSEEEELMEIMNTIRTLQVDITRESTEPRKGTPGSAAYDLTCHKKAIIPAHGIAMVPLNLRLAIPQGYFLLLLSRSGLASKGIVALGGVIDADYRGPVCSILANSTDEDFILQKGQRCCQGVFLPTHDANFKRVDKLEETERNDNGFGSTGTGSAHVQN